MSANSLYHSPRSEGNKPGPGAKIINFEKEKRFTTLTNKACHCGFALSLQIILYHSYRQTISGPWFVILGGLGGRVVGYCGCLDDFPC